NVNMCNDSCDGAVCTTVGECFVNFQVFEPDPQLVCPEVVDPIRLNPDCSVTIPDLRNDVTILACTELSGIEVNQDPAPGTVIFSPGFDIEISFNISEIAQCSVFLPVLPVTECPEDFTLFTDDAVNCATSMPADLCDAYLPLCNEFERLGILYSCRTEPEAGAQLPVGENEVRLIIENCVFQGQGVEELGNQDCIELPELSCTLTITVEGPEPELICPEIMPEFDPLQVSADCTVVVPDYRDQFTVNACEGTDYELMQYPEPGETVQVGNYPSLYVEVYLDQGKGSDYCYFFVPLTPYFVCPDSPQVVSYDENCEAVVPDLRDQVQFADCCGLGEGTRGEFSRCGEIRITQTPEPGSPLTGETIVSILVERCYFFEQARGDEECEFIGSCDVVVTPVDDTPPVIENCPASQSVNADADCLGNMPDITGLAVVTDNCTASNEIVVTQSPEAGTPLELGTTVITVTATDAAGNSTTCSLTVVLNENGCNDPPATDTPPTMGGDTGGDGDTDDPAGQNVPGCDPNTQSLNLLFSLLFHSPVCGATCPIAVSMMAFGFLALRRSVRRRRK
ncbi:MAG TPA: HYR domain-containing protein, partial [Phycisphaerae bacterium]|nr:HYR domain-containing protein [Phycisphaerae bacterium]